MKTPSTVIITGPFFHSWLTTSFCRNRRSPLRQNIGTQRVSTTALTSALTLIKRLVSLTLALVLATHSINTILMGVADWNRFWIANIQEILNKRLMSAPII